MRIPPNVIKAGTFIGTAGAITAGGSAAAKMLVSPAVSDRTQKSVSGDRPEDVVAKWFDADAQNSTAHLVGIGAMLAAGSVVGARVAGANVPRFATPAAVGVAVAATAAIGYTDGRDNGLLRQIEKNQESLVPGSYDVSGGGW